MTDIMQKATCGRCLTEFNMGVKSHDALRSEAIDKIVLGSMCPKCNNYVTITLQADKTFEYNDGD